MMRHLMRWRAVLTVFFVLSLVASSLPLSAAQAQESQADSPEQQLVDRFAPVVMRKEQPAECSTTGEPFLPVAVDIVLDWPEVELRRIASGDEADDPVIMTGPTAQDLAGLDHSYYLDLPGNPRNPGCEYEKWGRERMAELGLEPSIYARIATEEGRQGIVIQYWFYWIFNAFNNTHESDWEMIQLMFDASSVQEILDQNLLPTELAYAQHEGGERGSWDDEKVNKRDDTHVYTYPAAGSHADYYQSAIWIGWGEDGSGFGCDDSSPISVETPVEVILLPDDVDPDGPFAWLTYDGLWGSHEEWVFSGPTGPNAKDKWPHPISWTDNIRESSLPAPHHQTVGPGPTRFFCAATELGGAAMTVFPLAPRLVTGLIGFVIVLLLLISLLTWRYLVRGIKVYAHHFPVFLITSAILYPIAVFGTWIEDQISRTRIGAAIVNFTESGSISSFIFGMGIGSIQQLLILTLVAPVIIQATYDLTRKDPASLRRSWSIAIHRFPSTLGAILLNIVLLTLMTLTIVLIPLAIYRGIQWLYTPHAVIIDGAKATEARHVSKSVVKGDWLRALGMAILIGVVSGLPGPFAGVIGFTLIGTSMNTADIISGIAYSLAYPLAIIATTLFYLNISNRLAVPIHDPMTWRRRPKKLAIDQAPAASPAD
jgi:hypothetical protein